MKHESYYFQISKSKYFLKSKMNKKRTTLPGKSHIQVIKKELVIIIKRRYNIEQEKLKCNKAAQSLDKS